MIDEHPARESKVTYMLKRPGNGRSTSKSQLESPHGEAHIWDLRGEPKSRTLQLQDPVIDRQISPGKRI